MFFVVGVQLWLNCPYVVVVQVFVRIVAVVVDRFVRVVAFFGRGQIVFIVILFVIVVVLVLIVVCQLLVGRVCLVSMSTRLGRLLIVLVALVARRVAVLAQAQVSRPVLVLHWVGVRAVHKRHIVQIVAGAARPMRALAYRRYGRGVQLDRLAALRIRSALHPPQRK